jgi:hypothetical protein
VVASAAPALQAGGYGGYLDHVKSLLFTPTPFDVSAPGTNLTVTARMRMKVSN